MLSCETNPLVELLNRQWFSLFKPLSTITCTVFSHLVTCSPKQPNKAVLFLTLKVMHSTSIAQLIDSTRNRSVCVLCWHWRRRTPLRSQSSSEPGPFMGSGDNFMTHMIASSCMILMSTLFWSLLRCEIWAPERTENLFKARQLVVLEAEVRSGRFHG